MNNVFLFLTILLSIPFTSLLASDFWNMRCLGWVCGIESGVVVASHAGKSKIFPIVDPADEFYKYSPKHKTQTRGIYGGFVGARWRRLCNWEIQFDVKYSQSSPFSVNGRLTQGIDVPSQNLYHYRYKISIRQLLAEVKFSHVSCSRFRSYVIAGIGSSFNKTYSFSTTVPDLLTFTRIYKGKSKTGFTYAIGAGLDVIMTKCLYLGIGYRFINFGRIALGSASIDDIPVLGTLSQSKFYANQVSAQLTFLF